MKEQEYAGFWIRFGALLIDSVIMFIVLYVPLSFIYGEEYWLGDQFIYGFWDVLLGYVVPIVATIWFWLRFLGTPGKMATKLKIVDAKTGNKLSLGQAIGRYFAYIPAMLPLGLPNQGESPILEGMQDFCEFYAAKEIQGKNFWEDNEEVKSLVNLSYTFLNIEHAGVLKLDEIGNVQKMETVAKGATASCTLYPSEICKGLVKDSAEQWVIFHNHPSGDTKASDADISLTTHIEKVSKLLNRPLIEHFIIAGENIFEFSKDPALVSELTKNAQESKTIYLEHQEELER